LGLVASFNRPGGNLTGLTQDAVETAAKQLQVVKDMLPTAVQIAARSLQLTVQVLRASTERDIDAVFATLAQEPFDALHVMSDQSFFGRRAQLAALAKRQALPAVYALRQYVEAGGLISYGPDLADNCRYAGIYTGRILKGEKPADLPVVQPTKIELVINLTTAKALGLQIPSKLLARADELIE